MRTVCICALALLLAIPLAGCGIDGLTAATPAPIIIIASPVPTAALPTMPAETPAQTPQASPSSAPVPPVASAAAPTAQPEPTSAPASAMLQVQFSNATLVDIFRGEITAWDDPRIQADNPGVPLPKLPIQVVYRSDSSGTTRAITEYFVQVDVRWREQIGAAYRLGDAGSRPWPVGTGTNGSGQVITYIKANPGAIGYAAPSYAIRAGLPVAVLQNAAGNWVAPAASTLNEAAATSTAQLDARLRGFIVNAAGPNAYPLAIYTWIISCPSGLPLEQAQALTDFLYWAITDPQAAAAARQLGYEPLPPAVRQKVIAQLEAIRIDDRPVFAAPTADRPFRPRDFPEQVILSGSGATFPAPLYQELVRRYQRVQPNVALSYEATGSTAGRADLLQSGFVQFAGSDEAVVDQDAQIERAVCQPAPLHVPMVVGAVGVIYNLPSGP